MKELQKGIWFPDFKYQQDIFGCDIASYESSEFCFTYFQVCVLNCIFFGHDSFQRSIRAKPFHLIAIKFNCNKVALKWNKILFFFTSWYRKTHKCNNTVSIVCIDLVHLNTMQIFPSAGQTTERLYSVVQQASTMNLILMSPSYAIQRIRENKNQKRTSTEWSYEISMCKRNKEKLPWSPVLACARTVMPNADQMLWVRVECGDTIKSGFLSDVFHYFWSPINSPYVLANKIRKGPF